MTPSRRTDDGLQEGPAAFDRLVEVYDTLTAAPERARREADILKDILETRGATSVHETACGPGHLLANLARLGYSVSGSDGSPAMVERARALLAEHGASVEVADLARPPRSVEDVHDAVLCLGNSLPCVGGLAEIRRALRGLLRRTRPGGMLLVHAQHLARRESGRTWSGPVRSGTVDGRETILLRHYRRGRGSVAMDVVTLTKDGETWSESIVPVRLTVVAPDWLRATLREAGASRVKLSGNLAGDPFENGRSGDVFVLATRKVR